MPGWYRTRAAALSAWWSGSVRTFLDLPDATVLGVLSHQQSHRYRGSEPKQVWAWKAELPLLRAALRDLPDPEAWRVLLEFEIPRLGGRLDAVLLSPHAIFAIEFKVGATRIDNAARAQVHGYALDLQDFHGGSRNRPILPILVATDGPSGPVAMPLPVGGAAAVMEANARSLPGLLRQLSMLARTASACPRVAVADWEAAPYAPVLNVVEAACRLYRRHDVAEIASMRADAFNLSLTANRIAAILDRAEAGKQHAILFVTGIPGAGKTLCGLNAAFARAGSTFLTGNPSLVHVLREALVRSAVADEGRRTTAFHRIKAVIQPLPQFRDLYVRTGGRPSDRVVVIDEAQRCWTAAHAVASTRTRPVPLDRSEPAHLLDIMDRHEGSAAIVCLIGQGQEIHDGEGGLAAWGEALAERPNWTVYAADATLVDPEPRNRLPRLVSLCLQPDLHLSVPVRSLRHEAAPAWVDAVLRGDAAAAKAVIAAGGEVPFRLTRDLAALRRGLHAQARGLHRAGLVASAGARRLRAEGLGCEVPHMDPAAVSAWFLNNWIRDRDVRASDALELVATQFSVQGLELDQVGVCWDGDLVREGPGPAWQVRSFRGTRWQVARNPDKVAWRLNTYRVLLTRARYETLIWVPPGDRDDPSRDPVVLDRVAAFLEACGIRALAEALPAAMPVLDPVPLLLAADG